MHKLEAATQPLRGNKGHILIESGEIKDGRCRLVLPLPGAGAPLQPLQQLLSSPGLGSHHDGELTTSQVGHCGVHCCDSAAPPGIELTHLHSPHWPALQPWVPSGLPVTRPGPPWIRGALPLYPLSRSRNSLSICVGRVILWVSFW